MRTTWLTRTIRIEVFIVLLGCSLLLVAISLFLGFNANSGQSEDEKVDTSKYQAVFLSGGVADGKVIHAPYFGKITELNSKYLVLQDVYFLTNNQANLSSQTTGLITKQGCGQLHYPANHMVINHESVAYWQNLNNDAQVVKAIRQHQQQYPNGQDCSQPAQTTPAGSATDDSASTQTEQTP